jgi:lipoprotein-anchoring transpeptidase ErfK/SrfK
MARDGRHVRRRRLTWVSVLLVVTGVLVVGVAGAAYAGYRYEANRSARILPGLRIHGIDVGGMTEAEALRALEPSVDAILQRPVEVTAGGRSWSLTAGSLGTKVDVTTPVDQALGASRALGWPTRLYHRLLDRPIHGSFDLVVTYDETYAQAFVSKIASDLHRDPTDAYLDFTDGHLVRRHSVAGRRLRTNAATRDLQTAVRDGTTAVDLAVRTVAPKVADHALGMTIIVRISQNKLYLYDGLKLVKTYSVATGQLGVFDTPQGHFEIVNKRINPTWVNPATTTWGKDEPAVIPPGPDNPLGTRALDLSAPGIRIHGTPDDASIGHWASHGCIRMHIPDAEQLFDLVDVGTPVIIAW